MVTKIRIYFEGDTRLRPGFRQFLSEIAEVARSKRCHFDLVAANGTPVEDFRDALKTHANAWNVLLLDGEGPLNGSNALHAKGLPLAQQDSVFWMVEIMESWFLADIDALKRFYDGGFQESALTKAPNVEQIPKAAVLSRLKRATSGTKAGVYHKTKHAPKLLQVIDPTLVRKAAPNCERMFKLLRAGLG